MAICKQSPNAAPKRLLFFDLVEDKSLADEQSQGHANCINPISPDNTIAVNYQARDKCHRSPANCAAEPNATVHFTLLSQHGHGGTIAQRRNGSARERID